jgi:ABC-type multidrug transport system ATPase subunit
VSTDAPDESVSAVRVHGLTRRFGDDPPVLDDFDLTLNAGETTVLMGPNGTGKTVLLACLTGGLRPTSGTVEVFGRPPEAGRGDLVFALQDGLAVEDLSGRENAEFYTALHPAATDRWKAVADRLRLDGLDRRVADYSGGMIRKLELALTLSVDVPLYVLDEPTAELDPTAVERFHAMLDDLADAGRTVVLSSHSPRDLRAADRLVVVADSGVVADGHPDDLREAVPPVVVIDGADTDLDGHLRGARLFDTDTGLRGFLTDDADASVVEERADVVRVERPTPADVFNYYVHLRA